LKERRVERKEESVMFAVFYLEIEVRGWEGR
jgi:hypothetical protein